MYLPVMSGRMSVWCGCFNFHFNRSLSYINKQMQRTGFVFEKAGKWSSLMFTYSHNQKKCGNTKSSQEFIYIQLCSFSAYQRLGGAEFFEEQSENTFYLECVLSVICNTQWVSGAAARGRWIWDTADLLLELSQGLNRYNAELISKVLVFWVGDTRMRTKLKIIKRKSMISLSTPTATDLDDMEDPAGPLHLWQ